MFSVSQFAALCHGSPGKPQVFVTLATEHVNGTPIWEAEEKLFPFPIPRNYTTDASPKRGELASPSETLNLEERLSHRPEILTAAESMQQLCGQCPGTSTCPRDQSCGNFFALSFFSMTPRTSC